MSKRIRDLRSPVTEWRKWLFDAASVPFARLSDAQRFWLGFGVLSILTTLLIHNPLWQASRSRLYQEGDIAREAVISPADVYFVDEEASASEKLQAREAVKPIFRYESNKAESAVQGFVSTWEKLQRHGGETSAKPSNS